MRSLPLKYRSAGLLFSPLLSFLLLFSSCKVQLIPDFNAALSQEINTTAKKVDNFYLTMLETPAASRRFSSFTDKYIDVEVDLNSLLTQNRIRPLNQQSTRVTEIALQLWTKYKEEHKKDNALSDGLVKLNRKTLADLFYAMRVAEEAKNIPNPTP